MALRGRERQLPDVVGDGEHAHTLGGCHDPRRQRSGEGDGWILDSRDASPSSPAARRGSASESRKRSRPRERRSRSRRATARRSTPPRASSAGPGFVFDSDDLDAIPGLLDGVEAALGPIDIYIANTGGPPPNQDPLGFSREEWSSAHRTLVLSPMTILQRLLPGMRERGWGRVVLVASSAVREPLPSCSSRTSTGRG